MDKTTEPLAQHDLAEVAEHQEALSTFLPAANGAEHDLLELCTTPSAKPNHICCAAVADAVTHASTRSPRQSA